MDGERRGLIQGKSYQVISYSKQEDGIWYSLTGEFINPKEARFFIKVVNEEGIEADYWNDYFLSTEEMREIKIDKLLL
jgi:hypothetical protein